ncbi:collectin-12-like [Mercenaria mercenaria]|uniref:collectin-12-like n=1 Tax=Mercenaria mercenaria TaxID=6596 RepID=UPI00234F6F4F|nr:collectin-12-like [Mercenaria mercenaria]
MENVRLYVLTGLFGALLVVCSGVTLFHILKAKFDDRIEKMFEGLESEIKHTFTHCEEGVLRGEFYLADENYIKADNETDISELYTEEMLCQNPTGNKLSKELQAYCNATQRLDARMNILENTISEGGKKGERGKKGKDGSPGLKGEKGSEGKTGQKGNRGTRGMKGDEGEKGMVGAAGDKGVRGEQGPTGPKGDTGEIGIPGIPGMDGDPGFPGAPGLDGVPGRPGSKGNKGRRGMVGRKGDKGESSFTQLAG